MPEKLGRSSKHRKIGTQQRETRSKSHGPHHGCRPLNVLQLPVQNECGEEKLSSRSPLESGYAIIFIGPPGVCNEIIWALYHDFGKYIELMPHLMRIRRMVLCACNNRPISLKSLIIYKPVHIASVFSTQLIRVRVLWSSIRDPVIIYRFF